MFTKLLEKIQLTIGVISLSIFFIAILIQVTTRYFGISAIWTEEIANYTFIWSIFMGASVMLNRKEHFRFDMLHIKLKGKAKVILDLFVNLILLVFNSAIFYYGIIILQNFWNYTWITLPFLKMGYVWISIPIMGLTMAIYSIGHILNNINQLRGREITE